MARRVRKVVAVVAAALLSAVLAACGSTPASARHVVHSPAAPDYPAQGAPATPGPGTDPLESAAAQQAVTDVRNGLGALDSGLAQVDSDLNSPQADS
jgi:hypothetical protein